MRKNIYIKAHNKELFEWASNIGRRSLSDIIVEALTLYRFQVETAGDKNNKCGMPQMNARMKLNQARRYIALRHVAFEENK